MKLKYYFFSSLAPKMFSRQILKMQTEVANQFLFCFKEVATERSKKQSNSDLIQKFNFSTPIPCNNYHCCCTYQVLKSKTAGRM
jgi:hypothetical protein